MNIVNITKIYKNCNKLLENRIYLYKKSNKMFTFKCPTGPDSFVKDNHSTSFVELWKMRWDKLHEETGIFRYKIENLQEKIIDGKYLVQLNPDRGTKRRTPEHIENICQPFDENKFNFTKVSHKEVLFDIEKLNDTNTHKLIVNVSPITRYHSLLCPSVSKKLPQVVTEDSLRLVLEVMFLAQDRNLRIGFNSLCAMASVNHLHYHLFLENHDLPVESIKCTKIKGPLYMFDKTYPAPAFCFEVLSAQFINDTSKYVYRLIEHLLKNSIAHNIFITRGSKLLPGEQNLEVTRVIIWPRKSSPGPKIFTAFYIALCELSGWFPVYCLGVCGTVIVSDFHNTSALAAYFEIKATQEDIKFDTLDVCDRKRHKVELKS